MMLLIAVVMIVITIRITMGISSHDDHHDPHHDPHSDLDLYGYTPYIRSLERKDEPMFAMIGSVDTGERMTARKEVRMRPSDESRIKAAAATVGLNEADFIRQAALQQVDEVERRSRMSVLPVEAFEAFKSAVSLPGKFIPGLAKAAAQAEGILKDA